MDYHFFKKKKHLGWETPSSTRKRMRAVDGSRASHWSHSKMADRYSSTGKRSTTMLMCLQLATPITRRKYLCSVLLSTNKRSPGMTFFLNKLKVDTSQASAAHISTEASPRNFLLLPEAFNLSHWIVPSWR